MSNELQLQEKSRMEMMQDRMDTVLDQVIAGTMDLDRAKVVNGLFQTFINSANAQTAFSQRTNTPPAKHAMLPTPVAGAAVPIASAWEKTVEQTPNGLRSTTHRLKG